MHQRHAVSQLFMAKRSVAFNTFTATSTCLPIILCNLKPRSHIIRWHHACLFTFTKAVSVSGDEAVHRIADTAGDDHKYLGEFPRQTQLTSNAQDSVAMRKDITIADEDHRAGDVLDFVICFDLPSNVGLRRREFEQFSSVVLDDEPNGTRAETAFSVEQNNGVADWHACMIASKAASHMDLSQSFESKVAATLRVAEERLQRYLHEEKASPGTEVPRALMCNLVTQCTN
tara:strand:- start:105 stop:794 length:690 start_codon:yes stop_codon:yes gene_type:complete